jgi:hypothetical protein
MSRFPRILPNYEESFRKCYEKLKEKIESDVENRFELSVVHVASIWYCCWLKAGELNLSNLLNK